MPVIKIVSPACTGEWSGRFRIASEIDRTLTGWAADRKVEKNIESSQGQAV
jgi:hypothetical protein